MEPEGAYSFNIAVVGPNDELNSKFLNLIAETHGHVDGVEFHQSKIDKIAALIYWQPHEDSMSPILVSHSLKNANGAIIILPKQDKRMLEKYLDLIQEHSGDIPVKKIIFKKDMTIEEIGNLAFNSMKDLAAQLIVEAEQQSKKLMETQSYTKKEVRTRAGEPEFYVDQFGIITKVKTKGALPLYQDERFSILSKKKIETEEKSIDDNIEKKESISHDKENSN
ncbi:MAG: hypothetical protein ACTSO9_16065 [Candidatus Helarchaeota archaeon]